MKRVHISVHPITDRERPWTREIYRSWGADFVVTRGRKVYPDDTEGLYATDLDGNQVGLLTYQINGDQCEIITLDAFDKFRGIGTALIEKLVQLLEEEDVRRLWLITTNDNLDAIRFYQRRGFTISTVHVNALEHSRRLKPTIPVTGMYGIPLRDEVEFEMLL
jgi:ribosomal protein S18 acetylase RimI-like enzyme